MTRSSERPTEKVAIRLPGGGDGTKVCLLWTQQATAEYFKLFEIPEPGGSDAVDSDYRRVRDPGRTRTQVTGWYRIAYAPNPQSTKPFTARFRCSSEHTLFTLGYLADYLNSTGVPWLYLCNRHGNPLSRSSFRATAMAEAVG